MNPLYEKKKRDELKNPKWSEDGDLGKGPMEFIDDEEVGSLSPSVSEYA